MGSASAADGIAVWVIPVSRTVRTVVMAREHPVSDLEETPDHERHQRRAGQRDEGSWDGDGDHGWLAFSACLHLTTALLPQSSGSLAA
jgi:hypothetical protein